MPSEEQEPLIQRPTPPTRTGFFQRIRNIFEWNKIMRRLIQLLVLINLFMFFSFIIGTAAVLFAVVMLDNFVYNQASGVPLRCYENLSLKQRFNILTLITCKDKFNKEKAEELGLNTEDALTCIDAFNDVLKHKMDDYEKRFDSAIESFDVRLDLITKNTLKAIKELKNTKFLVLFKPLFELVELCVRIIDRVLEVINAFIESIYQVLISLFMSVTYGKNIAAIILYVIAGVIIFIMIIIIAIFFALLPVPWFKIPALIYLAVVIGPLLFAKLVVTILKAMSKLLLLKKIEESRTCEEYGENDCVYNSSFKYCKWYKDPYNNKSKEFCYNPRLSSNDCSKFEDSVQCSGVDSCKWDKYDNMCIYNYNQDDTPTSPSGSSRRSLKRERPPPPTPRRGNALTAINNRVVDDQKFDDDQDIPGIP